MDNVSNIISQGVDNTKCSITTDIVMANVCNNFGNIFSNISNIKFPSNSHNTIDCNSS